MKGGDALFRAARRAALSRHPMQTGIDYVDVAPAPSTPDGWLLHLYFVPPAAGITKAAVPSGVGLSNLLVTGQSRAVAADLRVRSVTRDPNDASVLVVALQRATRPGASSSPAYTLALVNLPSVDPFFSQVGFALVVDDVTTVDPLAVPAAPPPAPPPPEIDYLAKDYASFRQLMLDRLSVVTPQWQERNAADLGVALVEVLAYAADQLSYYQDAAATEAYLGTARRRVSMRRHARLLDYALHDGCNARAWVQVQVNADSVLLPAGTPLLTRVGQQALLAPEAAAVAQASGAAQEFATLHPAVLSAALNEIHFYTWGASDLTLAAGATSATLLDAPLAGAPDGRTLASLQPGDVLIFEEIKDPATGRPADADPTHRCAVRLTSVTPTEDLLGGLVQGASAAPTPIVAIAWLAADALPFALTVAAQQGDQAIADVSVARGNIVLADHGATIAGEALPIVPTEGAYQPRLQLDGLTFRQPYDDAAARQSPAAAALSQDPRAAAPAVTLTGQGASWAPRRDLLGSDRFARAFVVETESDGHAYLRVGDDVYGQAPSAGAQFTAAYRVGNGAVGNVGPEAIAHVVAADPRLVGVRNPLAAAGGVDAEPIEQVRRFAPQALRTQQRCVTASDYVAAAQRHPLVQQAAALLRWTGSWYTAFVAVTRRDGLPIDDAFRAELAQFLTPLRLAGYDLEIRPPRIAALDIALTVMAAADRFRGAVRQALGEALGNAALPDGRRGFFAPANVGFGQPVHLSQLVSAAMAVPGVVEVTVERFGRWGQPPRGELAAGVIPIGSLAIARLDNAAAAPQDGTLTLTVEGGR